MAQQVGVELLNSRDKMLRVEAIILGVLLLITVLVTHQLVRGSLDTQKPVKVVSVPNFVNASSLEVVAKSVDLTPQRQETSLFRNEAWVTKTQIFVPNANVGGFIEFRLLPTKPGRYHLSLYMTRAGDYGIVQVLFNGKVIGTETDLFARQVGPIGPLDFGTVEVGDEAATLRFVAVKHNEAGNTPFYQMGIQGYTLTPL